MLTEPRIAKLRIRSVRMKNGGASIRVLHEDRIDEAPVVREWVDFCLKGQGDDIAGFAFVVWGKTGGATCKVANTNRSRIPLLLIPDFVRNRLLTEEIIDLAVEEIKK